MWPIWPLQSTSWSASMRFSLVVHGSGTRTAKYSSALSSRVKDSHLSHTTHYAFPSLEHFEGAWLFKFIQKKKEKKKRKKWSVFSFSFNNYSGKAWASDIEGGLSGRRLSKIYWHNCGPLKFKGGIFVPFLLKCWLRAKLVFRLEAFVIYFVKLLSSPQTHETWDTVLLHYNWFEVIIDLKLIWSIYHFCGLRIEFFERSSVVRGNKETFSFEFLGHSFQKCLVHQS